MIALKPGACIPVTWPVRRMIVFPNNPTLFCDVDETLIMWTTPDEGEKDTIYVTCPASSYDFDGETFYSTEWTQLVKVHVKHVDRLKKHAARGHIIIVWSSGGADWAEACVKALHLESIVTATMKKPDWYIDDLKAEEFMGERIYDNI